MKVIIVFPLTSMSQDYGLVVSSMWLSLLMMIFWLYSYIIEHQQQKMVKFMYPSFEERFFLIFFKYLGNYSLLLM